MARVKIFDVNNTIFLCVIISAFFCLISVAHAFESPIDQCSDSQYDIEKSKLDKDAASASINQLRLLYDRGASDYPNLYACVNQGYYSKQAYNDGKLELLEISPRFNILSFFFCTMFDLRLGPGAIDGKLAPIHECVYNPLSIPLSNIISNIFTVGNILFIVGMLIGIHIIILLIEMSFTGQFLGGKPLVLLIRFLLVLVLILPIKNYQVFFCDTKDCKIGSDIGAGQTMKGVVLGGSKDKDLNEVNFDDALKTEDTEDGHWTSYDSEVRKDNPDAAPYQMIVAQAIGLMVVTKAIQFANLVTDKIYCALNFTISQKCKSDSISSTISVDKYDYIFKSIPVIPYVHVRLQNSPMLQYSTITKMATPGYFKNDSDNNDKIIYDKLDPGFNFFEYISTSPNFLRADKAVNISTDNIIVDTADIVRVLLNSAYAPYFFGTNGIIDDDDDTINPYEMIDEKAFLKISPIDSRFTKFISDLWNLASCMNSQAFYCINLNSDRNSLHFCPSPASNKMIFNTDSDTPLYPSLTNVIDISPPPEGVDTDTESYGYNPRNIERYYIAQDLIDLNLKSTDPRPSGWDSDKPYSQEHIQPGVYTCPTTLYPSDPLGENKYDHESLSKLSLDNKLIRFGWWEGSANPSYMAVDQINYYNWLRNINLKKFVESTTSQGSAGDMCVAPKYNSLAGQQCGYIDFSGLQNVDFSFENKTPRYYGNSLDSEYSKSRQKLIRLEVLKLYQIFSQIQQKMLMEFLKKNPAGADSTNDEAVFKKPDFYPDYQPQGLCGDDRYSNEPVCRYRAEGLACGSLRQWPNNPYYFYAANQQQQSLKSTQGNSSVINCNIISNTCNPLQRSKCAKVVNTNLDIDNGECEFDSVYCESSGKSNTCIPKGYECVFDVNSSDSLLSYDEQGKKYCEQYAIKYDYIVNKVLTQELDIELLRGAVQVPSDLHSIKNGATDNAYSSPWQDSPPNIDTAATQCFYQWQDSKPTPTSGCPGWDTDTTAKKFVPLCKSSGNCVASKCGDYVWCNTNTGKCEKKWELVQCNSDQDCNKTGSNYSNDYFKGTDINITQKTFKGTDVIIETETYFIDSKVDASCSACYGGTCLPPKSKTLNIINWQITKIFLALSPLSFKTHKESFNISTGTTDWMQFGFRAMLWVNNYLQTAFDYGVPTFSSRITDGFNIGGMNNTNQEMLFSLTSDSVDEQYQEMTLIFAAFSLVRASLTALGLWQVPACVASLGANWKGCVDYAQAVASSIIAIAGDAVVYSIVAGHTFKPLSDSNITDNYKRQLPFIIYKTYGEEAQKQLVIRQVVQWGAFLVHTGTSNLSNFENAAGTLSTQFQSVISFMDTVIIAPIFIFSSLLSIYYPMIPLFFWVGAMIGITISFLYFIMAFPFLIISFIFTSRGDEDLLGKIVQVIGTLIIFLMRPVLYIIAFVLALCFIWIASFLFEIIMSKFYADLTGDGWSFSDYFLLNIFNFAHTMGLILIASKIFTSCFGLVASATKFIGGQDSDIPSGIEAGSKLSDKGKGAAKEGAKEAVGAKDKVGAAMGKLPGAKQLGNKLKAKVKAKFKEKVVEPDAKRKAKQNEEKIKKAKKGASPPGASPPGASPPGASPPGASSAASTRAMAANISLPPSSAVGAPPAESAVEQSTRSVAANTALPPSSAAGSPPLSGGSPPIEKGTNLEPKFGDEEDDGEDDDAEEVTDHPLKGND